MNDDELLLLFSFLIYLTTFIFLVIKTSDRKKVLKINLTIHFIYSGYFLHGLFYRSQGNGTALAWWVSLLLILWIHWIINLVQLIYLFVKIKNKIAKLPRTQTNVVSDTCRIQPLNSMFAEFVGRMHIELGI